jgi:hypothetical protein
MAVAGSFITGSLQTPSATSGVIKMDSSKSTERDLMRKTNRVRTIEAPASINSLPSPTSNKQTCQNYASIRQQ